MSSTATIIPAEETLHVSLLDKKLKESVAGKWGATVFAVMLVGGLIYVEPIPDRTSP